MPFLARLFFSLISNLVALWVTVYFISGFEISPGFQNLLFVAAILTLINIFAKPLLKFILSPVVVLTLGFATFLINAFILYLLDKFLINITITGIVPLIYATIIISLVNIVINFSAKQLFKA